MDDWQDEVGKTTGNLIGWLIIAGIIVSIGIFVGGPILSIYTLAKGWNYTSGRVKAGAILLPTIGAIAVIGFIAQGRSYSFDPVSCLMFLSPFFSLALIPLAYYKDNAPVRSNLSFVTQPSAALTTRNRDPFTDAGREIRPIVQIPDPISSLSDSKTCGHCHSSNPTESKFCQTCGTPLYKPAYRKIQLMCSQCGAANPVEHKFCGKCGTALMQQ